MNVLCNTHVSQFNSEVIFKEYVFGFHVSVEDLLIMQVLENHAYNINTGQQNTGDS